MPNSEQASSLCENVYAEQLVKTVDAFIRHSEKADEDRRTEAAQTHQTLSELTRSFENRIHAVEQANVRMQNTITRMEVIQEGNCEKFENIKLQLDNISSMLNGMTQSLSSLQTSVEVREEMRKEQNQQEQTRAIASSGKKSSDSSAFSILNIQSSALGKIALVLVGILGITLLVLLGAKFEDIIDAMKVIPS